LPGIVPLHLNENLFQAAQDATSQSDIADLMQAALNQLHSYPKSGAKQLQKAVAAHLSIASNKLVIGHGSSAVLRDLFLYLLRKGDTLLMPAPGWSYYQALANLVEARIDTFALAEKGHSFAYDAFSIANKIGATQPKAVLICSPNNPTGSVMPVEDFIWLAQVYPQVNFILDEAYYGFADVYSAEQERLLLAATELANVFLVRTFSKFYGLANLRVGFAVCNEVNGRNLNKIAPVFGLPTFNQAVAAQRLANEQFAAEMKQEYTAVNDYVFNVLSQIPGMFPYQTAANFILVKHDGRWQEIEKTLLAQGYMIKRETINGDKNYLRITYADMATMQHLISLIQSFI
jgi:histidinol-phosphate aminotransferase